MAKFVHQHKSKQRHRQAAQKAQLHSAVINDKHSSVATFRQRVHCHAKHSQKQQFPVVGLSVTALNWLFAKAGLYYDLNAFCNGNNNYLFTFFYMVIYILLIKFVIKHPSTNPSFI